MRSRFAGEVVGSDGHLLEYRYSGSTQVADRVDTNNRRSLGNLGHCAARSAGQGWPRARLGGDPAARNGKACTSMVERCLRRSKRPPLKAELEVLPYERLDAFGGIDYVLPDEGDASTQSRESEGPMLRAL
jgi:hypothetical protein